MKSKSSIGEFNHAEIMIDENGEYFIGKIYGSDDFVKDIEKNGIEYEGKIIFQKEVV